MSENKKAAMREARARAAFQASKADALTPEGLNTPAASVRFGATVAERLAFIRAGQRRAEVRRTVLVVVGAVVIGALGVVVFRAFRR